MEFVRNAPYRRQLTQRTPYPSTLRPDDAPADITLDALYGVTMEMKTLFLRIIGLLMDITPQGTTSLTGNDDWPRVADIFLNVDPAPDPGNPHYHDDDMTCPTAPVTASSTDTPDAQPVAPATTTPDAQPVAPVTTTPVTPTPALETPVSSTAARDASPIAPAMATSLTTPHSVPSPTAVAAVSTAPSPAPELLAPSDAPPAPATTVTAAPPQSPAQPPMLPIPSLHPDYTAPTDASMPDSTTADSSGTERTEDVPMGDPRVSRGIIVDTPTLPSPHDDRDSPPDTDEDTSSDSEPRSRTWPPTLDTATPGRSFASSRGAQPAACRSNTPTGQPLLGTRPSDQAHYLLQHLTEFRSVIHVIMRLARAQPFAPGETATTWPHPNDPLADVLGRPEMLELFGLTPTEFTLVHQSKTPVVPCILQVAVNLARNLRTLHYDVEMTESDERFLNFDKITNTATRLATIRQLVQTVKFTAPLTGPDDIYLSTLRHGSPPPDIALSMRSTALARAWDIAAYFDHYKWDETRDRYGDSRFAHLYDVRDPAPSSDRPWPTSHAPLLSMLTEQVENVLRLVNITADVEGPGNFLRRYYTQLAVVAARDVHRLRTPPVSEAQAPREKRPNDEKLQKKERKAARLTPEEVDSIISRILSELHTVPFKEVLLSENADIPDVYFWAFLNEEWAKASRQHNRAGLPFRSFLITAADEFHPANKYADYFDCIYDEDNHAHLRDSASRQDVERCFYEIAMPDDLNAPPMTLTPANADLCGPRIVRFTHVAPAGPSRADHRGHEETPKRGGGAAPVRPDPKYFPVSSMTTLALGRRRVSASSRAHGHRACNAPVVHQVLGFPLSVHTWVYGIAAYLAAAVKLHGRTRFTNIMNYITTTKAEESRAYIWDRASTARSSSWARTSTFVGTWIARKPFVRPFVVWSTDFKDLRTNEPTGLARFGHIQAGTEVDAINEIHYGWPSNRHLNKLANADCKPILGVGYFSATMRNHRPRCADNHAEATSPQADGTAPASQRHLRFDTVHTV
eukprot:tig00000520_g1804.t1